jgi:hypothetical protein
MRTSVWLACLAVGLWAARPVAAQSASPLDQLQSVISAANQPTLTQNAATSSGFSLANLFNSSSSTANMINPGTSPVPLQGPVWTGYFSAFGMQVPVTRPWWQWW